MRSSRKPSIAAGNCMHRPKAVILFNCVQKLEERYALSTHNGFVQQVVDEMLEI